MKDVSVYVPCFNAATTIGMCLEAIFEQTHSIKEVVVIDDGSTDNTALAASSYPIRLIKHTTNKGLAITRNTALKNIDSEFIASLDADCLPQPDWLERLMRRFESPKIAGVGGRLVEKHASNVLDQWRSVHMRQYWSDEKDDPPFLFGSNTIFKREAFLKSGLYNESFKSNYEDVDLCKRLKKAGYALIYESKAIVWHLKKDDIYSLFNNYWTWHLEYYQRKKFYSNEKEFILKLKDNIGLANRYIEEDISAERYQLIYLDFLLAIHHSLKDFEYFINCGSETNDNTLSFLLPLLDLNFFYHFDYSRDNISTLVPRGNSSLQNFFALSLIFGEIIRKRFKSSKFKRILYRHLLLSLYRVENDYLLDKLLILVDSNRDWGQLYKKGHPNLNSRFLKNLFFGFQEWLGQLISNFKDIIKIIEDSAEETDGAVGLNGLD